MRRSHGEAVSGAAQVIKELPNRSLTQLLSGNLDFVRRNVGFVRNFGVLSGSYFGAIGYKHISAILEAREGFVSMLSL